MKKFWRLFTVLLAFTLTLSGCSDDELALEAKMVENTLENTEWRAKLSTPNTMTNRAYYRVLRFLPNKKFRLGDADMGGMVFRSYNSGVYRIDAKKRLVILEGEGATDLLSYYILKTGEVELQGASGDFKLQ